MLGYSPGYQGFWAISIARGTGSMPTVPLLLIVRVNPRRSSDEDRVHDQTDQNEITKDSLVHATVLLSAATTIVNSLYVEDATRTCISFSVHLFSVPRCIIHVQTDTIGWFVRWYYFILSWKNSKQTLIHFRIFSPERSDNYNAKWNRDLVFLPV